MTKNEMIEIALGFNACDDAIEWLKSLSDEDDPWALCVMASWMMRFAVEYEVDHVLLVTASCACARLALPYLPPGEDRPETAIETAEDWTIGGATEQDVLDAAADAALVKVAIPSREAAVRAAWSVSNVLQAMDALSWTEEAMAATESREDIEEQLADVIRTVIPSID